METEESKNSDQFFCMIFGKLAKKRSLRDTVFTLQVMKSKLYHLGILSNTSLNTFSNASTKRDWRIYHDYVQSLIRRARALDVDEKIDLELKNIVYAIDSSIIDLWIS